MIYDFANPITATLEIDGVDVVTTFNRLSGESGRYHVLWVLPSASGEQETSNGFAMISEERIQSFLQTPEEIPAGE